MVKIQARKFVPTWYAHLVSVQVSRSPDQSILGGVIGFIGVIQDRESQSINLDSISSHHLLDHIWVGWMAAPQQLVDTALVIIHLY
jgi:hypothetical protein